MIARSIVYCGTSAANDAAIPLSYLCMYVCDSIKYMHNEMKNTELTKRMGKTERRDRAYIRFLQPKRARTTSAMFTHQRISFIYSVALSLSLFPFLSL